MTLAQPYPYALHAGARIPHGPRVCVAGPTWSDRSIDLALWTAITSGNGRFVAGGGNPNLSETPPCYSFSDDFGEHWSSIINTPAAGGTQVQPNCLKFGAGLFVSLIASTLSRVSTDGETWEDVTTPNADKAYLEFGNAAFLWLTAAANVVYKSLNGRDWVAKALPNMGDTSWLACAYDRSTGLWTAISNTKCATSADNGETWTPRGTLPHTNYTALAVGAGILVAVQATLGNTVDYSLDGGDTWFTATFPTILAFNYRTALYRQGAFLVFSVAGDVTWVATDPTTWTAADPLSKFADGNDIWSTTGDGIGHYAGVATTASAFGDTHAVVGVC